MRFHGDLANAEPILKDLFVYDSGVIAGQGVAAAATDATDGAGGVIDPAGADALIDMVGVTAEAAPSTSSAVLTGIEAYCKVIVNPLAYYLAQWTSPATAETNTVASSSGELITDTTIDTDCENCWTYVTGPSTDTGYGNIMKIGQTDTTVKLTNVTDDDYDDELKALTTSSNYIIIRKPFTNAPGSGGVDLDSTFAKLDGNIAASGAAIVLENYINSKRFPMEPLRTVKHAGKNDKTATFYGDVYFCDHTLRGASTQP